MDFMIPKAQPPAVDLRLTNLDDYSSEDKHSETSSPSVVSSQLQIKSWGRSSSPEGLDKEVVLRRIRNHKCKNRVKSAFQALVGGSGQASEKWMEFGDAFTCP